MFQKLKKIMVRISMPLFFLLIGYTILFLLVSPYIRPMVSLYQMISQDQAPDFSQKQESLFDEVEEVPTQGDIANVSQMSIGIHYGQVNIPAVGIHVPLYYGSTDEVLYYGAGQRLQSKMPGYGKPVMIAGHTIPFFKNLGQIQVGDEIQIKTYYGEFVYRVSGSAVAKATDGSAYDLKQEKEQLILFTCYPLDGVGLKEDRLFVYADKISGPEVVGE